MFDVLGSDVMWRRAITPGEGFSVSGVPTDARCVLRPLIRDLLRGVTVVEVGNYHRSGRVLGGEQANLKRHWRGIETPAKFPTRP